MPACAHCHNEFSISDKESDFYRKFDAIEPDMCPSCRHLRRITFRNERKLFLNTSAKSNKKIISLYPEDSPFKIIDQDEWWDDDFDATIYGRDFDFNRSFFEQYKDLQLAVPRWAKITVNCENSEFSNNCAQVKNGYLTFSSYTSEDVFYCMRIFNCHDCIDCFFVSNSEFCSGCADSDRLYNVHYSMLSEGCSDSFYLYDCRNCKNCILCSQQNNKEYMFLNEQLTKEEFLAKKEQFIHELHTNKESLDKKLLKLAGETPHRALHQRNTENCLGNFINNSKNIQNGFYIIDAEDCLNIYNCSKLKNCYDNSYNEESELCLEIDTCYNLYNSKFCTYCITLENCAYCDQSDHLTDCFGCIGLKKQQNMILNKKYNPNEYQKMMSLIKEHMQKTGEWGKPFPAYLTPFAYNTTLAHEYAPLTKEEALKGHFTWHNEKPKTAPNALICQKSGEPYQTIPQEAKFYAKFNLPKPLTCPEQRYQDINKLRPPNLLRETTCSTCQKPLNTTYPQSWGLKIICDDCYKKIMF